MGNNLQQSRAIGNWTDCCGKSASRARLTPVRFTNLCPRMVPQGFRNRDSQRANFGHDLRGELLRNWIVVLLYIHAPATRTQLGQTSVFAATRVDPQHWRMVSHAPPPGAFFCLSLCAYGPIGVQNLQPSPAARKSTADSQRVAHSLAFFANGSGINAPSAEAS